MTQVAAGWDRRIFVVAAAVASMDAGVLSRVAQAQDYFATDVVDWPTDTGST